MLTQVRLQFIFILKWSKNEDYDVFQMYYSRPTAPPLAQFLQPLLLQFKIYTVVNMLVTGKTENNLLIVLGQRYNHLYFK